MRVGEVARVHKNERGCKSLWEWERLPEFMGMREVARVLKNERGCKKYENERSFKSLLTWEKCKSL